MESKSRGRRKKAPVWKKKGPPAVDTPASAPAGICPFSPSGGSPQSPGSGLSARVRPKRGSSPTYYHSYLQLDHLLSAQKPLSGVAGAPAHDELLFITTHQAYELWFKQILFELDAAIKVFGQNPLPEKSLSTIVHQLHRITKILEVTVGQIDILETMTPMSFLDFRDYLFPASGFQSLQFRIIENRLGLLRSQRISYSRAPYCAALAPEHKIIAESSELGPSLFDCVAAWLERTPFLTHHPFDFWTEYQQSVMKMLTEDKNEVKANGLLSVEDKLTRTKEIEETERTFQDFFDEKKYAALLSSKKRRLSLKATQAAIMINLYREEPIFQLPFQLLTLLLELDRTLTGWRSRHAMMVHRMLGMKMGTGGSSGYNYLKSTVALHKIFGDFADLSMFFLPTAAIPKLPRPVLSAVRFRSDSVDDD